MRSPTLQLAFLLTTAAFRSVPPAAWRTEHTVMQQLPRAPQPLGRTRVRSFVVTDMDETLISKTSTGYVIRFLVAYRAYARLALVPAFAVLLWPLSKISRPLAVRAMYWFAFRGVDVRRARAISTNVLAPLYARDLQDPAASAVVRADAAAVITASPTFMAAPWLATYLGVDNDRVVGAELEQANGRYTGRMCGELPMGEAKAVALRRLRDSPVGRDADVVGYGDHPTDLPLLEACDRGVLVHPLTKRRKRNSPAGGGETVGDATTAPIERVDGTRFGDLDALLKKVSEEE